MGSGASRAQAAIPIDVINIKTEKNRNITETSGFRPIQSSENFNAQESTKNNELNTRFTPDSPPRVVHTAHTREEDDYDYDPTSADMFSNTALSLGMDNDELLFNLLYFGSDEALAGSSGGDHLVNLGSMINSAVEETVALHSEGNTPYKLHPASKEDLCSLPTDIYHSIPDLECLVCRDIITSGDTVTNLQCQHCFHCDCILRWLNLVCYYLMLSYIYFT